MALPLALGSSSSGSTSFYIFGRARAGEGGFLLLLGPSQFNPRAHVKSRGYLWPTEMEISKKKEEEEIPFKGEILRHTRKASARKVNFIVVIFCERRVVREK